MKALNGLFLRRNSLTFSPATERTLRAISARRSGVICAARAFPPLLPSSAAALLARFGFEFLGFFAGRDPHDLDGVADHVGGALLTSGSARHQPSIHE